MNREQTCTHCDELAAENGLDSLGVWTYPTIPNRTAAGKPPPRPA